MTLARSLFVCSLVACGWTAAAQAQPVSPARSAYVVTRPEPGLVRADRAAATVVPLIRGHSAVALVRPVVDAGPTVGRDLSRQPVQPWLVPVRYANTTTIYVDPLENYQPYAWRGIDDNHSILKAQRLGLDQLARPTRVIRNPLVPVVQHREPGVMPRPILKFRKPEPADTRKVALAH